MTRDEARSALAALSTARDRWVADTVPTLHADAVWLVGSLGRGDADAWSDVDILVVGGECALDEALLTVEQPANGPAGGGYVGAMYAAGGLPLGVDWYMWPPGVPVPKEARLLAGSGPRGSLNLSDTLDLVGRGQAGPPPVPDVAALAMLPVAAKYVARGDGETAARIAAMVGAPPELPVGASLSVLLARIDGRNALRTRVGRYLDLVRALTEPDLWRQ